MGSLLFLPGCVVSPDDVVQFQSLRMWAERGLIHLEDKQTGWYGAMAADVAERRAKAVAQMALAGGRRQANTEDNFDSKCVQEHLEFVRQVERLCQKARIQGEPWSEEGRKTAAAARPLSFSLSGMQLPA